MKENKRKEKLDKAIKIIKKLYKENNPHIEYNKIQYGDTFYSEDGEEWILKLSNIELKIGYCTIIEDGEDWAQAESYTQEWITLNNKHIRNEEALSLLNNLDSIKRELKINSII
jgi:hypothetical protein